MLAITLEFAVAICFLIDEKRNISIRNRVYLHIDFAISPEEMLILVFEVGVISSKKGNSRKKE